MIWHAAFLEAVVHVMQKHAIKFLHGVADLIEGESAEAVRIPGGFETGEDRFTLEFVPNSPGDGQRIIADTIEAPWNSGNNLKERIQAESAVLKRASAAR